MFLLLFFSVSVLAESALQEQPFQKESLQVVPPLIYVVPGISITIYYDNLLLNHDSSKYQFETHCDIGHSENDGWVLDGEDLVPGTYPFCLRVTDETGESREVDAEVVVSAAKTERKSLSLMIVGDSLTNATHYHQIGDSIYAWICVQQ